MASNNYLGEEITHDLIGLEKGVGDWATDARDADKPDCYIHKNSDEAVIVEVGSWGEE